MRETLAAISLTNHHRLLSIAQLSSVGVTENDLARLIRNDHLIRLRRGQFIRGEDWPTDIEGQHVVHTAAAIASHRDQLIVASHSGALVLGLPVYGCDLRTIRTIRRSPGRLETGRRTRTPFGLAIGQSIAATTPVESSGLAVCAPALAGLQIAMEAGAIAGVVTLDAALHRRLCTPAEIEATLSGLTARPGLSRARQAAQWADGRAESPGESRLRLHLRWLGYQVEAQVKISSRSGIFAVADFYLREYRIIIEFDGALKYRTDAGNDGRLALLSEKVREDRLRAAGFETARFIWPDLDHPERIRASMEAAIRRAQLREKSSLRVAQ